MEEERYYDEYEIDLREYIMLLWENKWFIIGLFFIAIIGAFLFSQFYLTPIYQTEAVIQLPQIDGLYDNLEAVSQLKSNSLIKPIMEKHDQQLSEAKLNSYINNKITVKKMGNNQIKIVVKNQDNELAQKITNQMVTTLKSKAQKPYKEYISMQKEYISTLQQDIENISKRIDITNEAIDKINQIENGTAEKTLLLSEQTNLLNSLYEKKNTYQEKIQEIKKELLNLHPVEVLNEPYLPQTPISPNKKLNVAIAGVLALMLGVFIVFFRKFLKEEEIEKNHSA